MDENIHASIKDYATSIKNVQKKCKNLKFIVVGHGDWQSTKSLEHTLMMAKALENKN